MREFLNLISHSLEITLLDHGLNHNELILLILA